MQRRRLLRSAALTGSALALAPLLAACGFRLRGSARFAYGTLHLAAATPLAEELRTVLRANGLQVFGPQDPPERAQVVLLITGEQRARVVVSRTSNGQVRELQLRLSVRVSARSARGDDLITDLLMEQQREVSYNETAALAKEAEEEFLFRDMQSDLAQQLVRRLATLQPG
jgi:LPS-assembly lipoprotein